MVPKTLLILLSAVFFSTLSSAQAPQTPFTLSVSTQLVIQAVAVTDKDGKPLEGLTAEDFTLTEDNVPQTIGVFEFEKLDDTVLRPLPPAAPSPAPNFAAALQPAITHITPVPVGDNRYQDRRLLALYFDMHSGSIDRFRALTAAQTFIEANDWPRSRGALHLCRRRRSRPPRIHRRSSRPSGLDLEVALPERHRRS